MKSFFLNISDYLIYINLCFIINLSYIIVDYVNVHEDNLQLQKTDFQLNIYLKY